MSEERKLRLDWKINGGKQLLVMDRYGEWGRIRNCTPREKPAAHWANRTQWIGHGWFRMMVFQHVHGPAEHGWPIGKNEPHRFIANKRLNARMACFPWQSWDTL